MNNIFTILGFCFISEGRNFLREDLCHAVVPGHYITFTLIFNLIAENELLKWLEHYLAVNSNLLDTAISERATLIRFR